MDKAELNSGKNNATLWKALAFLGRFLLIYIAGHILYSLYIESCGSEPDVFTTIVTNNTASLLSMAGNEINTKVFESDDPEILPYITVYMNSYETVSVSNGCNGIVVMILFMAFTFAFSGLRKELLWFIPAGILIIHLFNLFRIVLLAYMSFNNSHLLHFMHKFLFTAIIYSAVFGMWIYWVNRILKSANRNTDETIPA